LRTLSGVQTAYCNSENICLASEYVTALDPLPSVQVLASVPYCAYKSILIAPKDLTNRGVDFNIAYMINSLR
jgi:hypothetical protein